MDNSAIADVTDEPRRLALQLMSVGSQLIAIDTSEIDAVAEWRQPTPLPGAPAAILGVICLEGRMLTVISVSALLDEPQSDSRKFIALRGAEQIAAAVDNLGEMISIDPTELRQTDTKESLLAGLITRDEQEVSFIDPRQLFATAMRGRERRRRRF
jgi:purine-binding chemotaxis protein CheW